MRCLVTGATGYIGGRLVPRLLDEGYEVRCLVRDPGKLRDVPWAARAEVVRGDVLDDDSVRRACADVDVVYFLIHSLRQRGFGDLDRDAAETVAEAAREAGVRRIVYLGGLHPEGELSEHLRSRAEVGRILLDSGVPTAVLQAAVIIGSGSASFEMLRYLTERLPAMVTPRWVRNRIQPIAVRDVLRYLVAAASLPGHVNRTFDIGGPDVLSYAEMMQRYARVAGLPRRVLVPVPVLTPRLSSHWVNLVTPVPRGIATPLIDSLVHEVVCDEHDIAEYVPDPEGGLIGYDQAVRLALARIRDSDVETRWSSAATPGAPSDPLPTDPEWSGGNMYVDRRQRETTADAATLWRVVVGIGGENGWYSFPLAWSIRGWLDRLVGGVGLRRGRRNPNSIYVGEALDFWRVEEIEPGRLLRLRAEMKVPGLAWLEMVVEPVDPATGGTSESGATYRPVGTGKGAQHGDAEYRARYRQRALFRPRGLAGHAYWWSVAPFHGIVFGGMARNIVRAAERQLAEQPTPRSLIAHSD